MSLPPYLLSDPPPVSPLPTKVRLQALYASTSSQRQSNPTGYAANVSWWSALLEELLRSGVLNEDRLVLRADEGVLGKLEWEGGRPKGLGGVVERLGPSVLHPLPHFLNSPSPIHAQASLTARFIGRPLWWAFSQLNPFGLSEEAVVKEDTLWSRCKGREYVHMPLLEQAAAAFTSYIRSNPPTSYSESLYSLVDFSDQLATIAFPRRKDGKRLREKEERLSKRDMEVLIRWLSRDCGIIVVQGDVVKILPEGEGAMDHPITEADKGTVTLRATLKKLEAQIVSIEQQIERCQQKAKHHLALSQKPIALSHLRSKRQLEEILLKRTSASHQLESILRSIDQAKGDIDIMAAYQTSTTTLKGILANPLLDIQEVERTTEEMAEVMANQEEVDSAIRSGGEIASKAGGSVEVDEDELKRELEEMVKDERERERSERERVERERVEKEHKNREAMERKMQQARDTETETKDAKSEVEVTSGNDKSAATPAENSEDEDAQRARRYEDAQQRQREEAARAEVERMRKAEKVAAE